jgi:hypothetical protein
MLHGAKFCQIEERRNHTVERSKFRFVEIFFGNAGFTFRRFFAFKKCPAIPINVPIMIVLAAIIGKGFLSVCLTCINTGIINAKEISPPSSHQGICGKSIFTMTIEMKKKYTKEATAECFGSFCIIIGVISIIPAAIPMITDNNNVSMIIYSLFSL